MSARVFRVLMVAASRQPCRSSLSVVRCPPLGGQQLRRLFHVPAVVSGCGLQSRETVGNAETTTSWQVKSQLERVAPGPWRLLTSTGQPVPWAHTPLGKQLNLSARCPEVALKAEHGAPRMTALLLRLNKCRDLAAGSGAATAERRAAERSYLRLQAQVHSCRWSSGAAGAGTCA